MIRELMALCAELKINIPAHDLINWLESRLDLVCHPHRIRGEIVLYVHTGCPFAEIMDKENRFYVRAKAIYESFRSTSTLRVTDIRDRFVSHGKLWLVLRGGKVVAEDTVRVYGVSCRSCGRVPKTARDETLSARQGRLCLDCFTKLLPEEEQFRYVISTNKSFRRSRGYSIDYDPICGTCKTTQTNSDFANRSQFLAESRDEA